MIKVKTWRDHYLFVGPNYGPDLAVQISTELGPFTAQLVCLLWNGFPFYHPFQFNFSFRMKTDSKFGFLKHRSVHHHFEYELMLFITNKILCLP